MEISIKLRLPVKQLVRGGFKWQQQVPPRGFRLQEQLRHCDSGFRHQLTSGGGCKKRPINKSKFGGKPDGQSPLQFVLCWTTFGLLILSASFRLVVGERMVRLCIASVDPVKLSSQCVMCNRREFPLTVIDCTGITKVNDLIANPLSVQEATCLIYNCRRVSGSRIRKIGD